MVMLYLGYKAVNKELKDKDMCDSYEVGKEYEVQGKLKIGWNGFHFCYFPWDLDIYHTKDHRYLLIEPLGLGGVLHNYTGEVSCVGKIRVIKELTYEELRMEMSDGEFLSPSGNKYITKGGKYYCESGPAVVKVNGHKEYHGCVHALYA